MKEYNFLAFDIGATSGRAVLGTLKDAKFEMKEIHRFPNPMVELHGRFYWDIYHLYTSLIESLTICARQRIRLHSIGIDTWGVDFGYVALDGSLLGLPRAYRDPYTDGAPEDFFKRIPKEEPLPRSGLSATLVGLYEDILKFASEEKSGYQQMISSIVLHILGSVYYKEKNNSFTNTYVVDKINEARILMKENIEDPLSPEEIAARLGLGYSWFRRMFKEYTGVSPAQYQLQQKLLRAKELLTSTPLTISEIAYSLHFENAGQFSTFFKKKEGVTPSEFRDRTH